MQEKKSEVLQAKLGTLRKTDDGRAYVHFERLLNHSIERVWKLVTDANELAVWFPGLTLQSYQGGKFEIWFGGKCEGPPHVSGIVTKYDPPNELVMGSMRYKLTATPTGCRLVFTDILHFDGVRSNKDFSNSVLGGWHMYMDTLVYALEGGDVNPQGAAEFDYSKVDVLGRD